MKIAKFKDTQKINMIIESTKFEYTVEQIRNGISNSPKVDMAAMQALNSLEAIRGGSGIADLCATGVTGNWQGFNIQLNMG